jgi:hypothetical protein
VNAAAPINSKATTAAITKGTMVVLLVAELVMEWVPANDGHELPQEFVK